MYQRLGDAQLKNAETVEIGVITPPDDNAERLLKLLGHKGWEWLWQVGLALDGKTDELETRFYVARRGGEIISNVCTFEWHGVGILGHVWTPPEERRKGLCKSIFEKLTADFRSRGDGLMLLGTGFDTPPYHIYRRFGFVGYYEGSGMMRYSADDDFEAKCFAPADARIVDATWSAWPRLNALVAEPEEFTKSVAYGLFHKNTVEDAYIYLKDRMAKDDRVCAKLLESDATGAIVGYAWVVPDKVFPDVFLLDLYSHPNHPKGYDELLAAMTWPEAKVQTFVETAQDAKARALEAAGFTREATLSNHLRKRDAFADLWVYARSLPQ